MECDMSTVASLDKETLTLSDSCAEIRSVSREEMLLEIIAGASEYDRQFRTSVEAGYGILPKAYKPTKNLSSS